MSSPSKWTHRGRTIRAQIRTTASPGPLWTAWTDPAHLAQWFTDGAEGKFAAGETFGWIFERFPCRTPDTVLERFAREVTLEWQGLKGTLEFMAFSPGRRDACSACAA